MSLGQIAFAAETVHTQTILSQAALPVLFPVSFLEESGVVQIQIFISRVFPAKIGDAPCPEVIFEQKPGYFRETQNDQVVEKVGEKGNLLGFSVLRISAVKKAPLEVALWELPECPRQDRNKDLSHSRRFRHTLDTHRPAVPVFWRDD